MNKKVISLIVFILIVVLIVDGYSFSKKQSQTTNRVDEEKSNIDTEKIENIAENNNVQKQDDEVIENTSDKKIAVVYFSATGTTKQVAEFIKDETNADIFEIIPKQKYSEDDLNWNDSSSRSTKEQNDRNARPEIANDIDVSNYEVIFIGYPIWWGDTPRIIQTFMENHELEGKTMIPFCTSGGSGISGSENTLKNYSGINWISGKRLTTSQSEVSSWVKSLNY